jgi:hypothetical protein
VHTVPLQAGAKIDRYLVEGLLGRGGMARVYLVRHSLIGSLHALKVLSVTDPALRGRLLQEGRIQGQFRDGRVVRVTDVIDVGGAPGLVMEYVAGPSLAQLIARRPPTLDLADRLVRALLGVMAAAHAHGLVHRDLKPANILLHADKQGLHIKVADFGLAKLLDAGPSGLDQTAAGAMMGTPRYMAPEQLRDASRVDARVDVFALGAILWEMLHLQPAFGGDDLPAIISAIDACESLDPTARSPHLPERMVRTMRGALRSSPDDRWPDAAAMLRAWTDGTTPVEVPWGEADIEAIRALAPVRADGPVTPVPSGTPWLSDNVRPNLDPSATVDLGGEESLVDDGGTEAESAPGRAEAPRAPRARRLATLGLVATLAAVVIGVGVGIGRGVWMGASPVERPAEGGETEDPTISADPAVQGRFERVWELIHRGDRIRAHALAKQVAEAAPTSAWARFAAFVSAPPSQAPGHLEAAARLATGPSAEDRLVRLCSQGMAGLGAPSDWDALEASSSLSFTPIARAMFAPGLNRVYDDAAARTALWERARERAPHSVLPWEGQVREALKTSDVEAASALLAQAQNLFPATPVLLAQEVEVALIRGEFTAARDAARRAVDLDGTDREAREGLACAHLHLGDDEAYARERATLLDQGTPQQQSAAAADLAHEAFGLGRLRETEALLQACRQSALDGDDASLGLRCELSASSFAFLLDDLAGLRDTVERLRQMAAAPTMPSLMQPVVQQRILLLDGIAAALGGDLDQALVDRGRLALSARQAKDVDIDGSLLFLDRAIQEARRQRDQDFVDDQVATQRNGALCQAARHLERVGEPHAAVPLYRRIVEGDTTIASHRGFGQFANAYAGLRLAELRIDVDPAEAARALRYFDAEWAAPDTDHPLVLRAEALRARVAPGP